MNKNKQAYDRPTTELFVVRFEQNILSGDEITRQGTEDGEVVDDPFGGIGYN